MGFEKQSGIYLINNENTNCIKRLYDGWNETLIWSCLQGCMGSAWADDELKPKSAQIIVADFCFFAGKPNEELVKNKPVDFQSNFIIMVPPNHEWQEVIERVYKENAKKVMRYAIKKEGNVFDKQKLRTFVDNVDSKYQITMINKEIYNQVIKEDWSRDFCSQFEDYSDYGLRGLGTVALLNGVVVAGASSYTVYNEGIEIEIDTKEEYRRKGLALACGAKLILECIDRGLYPSWDAQNKGSVALAEKLGYHYDKEYVAYEITKF